MTGEWTHRWRHRAPVPVPVWNAVLSDVKRVVRASPVPLALDRNQVQEPPVVGPFDVQFDGVGDRGHQPLRITHVPDPRADAGGWSSIDTAGRPYELAVIATLLLVRERAQAWVDVETRSSRIRWRCAVRWTSELFGRGFELPKTDPLFFRGPERM